MPVTDYIPTLDTVGSIALSRTVDDVGTVTGTFNEVTQPTANSVDKLIDKAIKDVAPSIGNDIPESMWEKAKNVVALRAAMYIELTFFAREIHADLSPYKEYKDLYESELIKLSSEVAGLESGENPTDALAGNFPAYGFPPADNLMSGEM